MERMTDPLTTPEPEPEMDFTTLTDAEAAAVEDALLLDTDLDEQTTNRTWAALEHRNEQAARHRAASAHMSKPVAHRADGLSDAERQTLKAMTQGY